MSGVRDLSAIATAVLLMDESGQYLRTVGTHGLPQGAGAALEAAWPAAINRSPVARAFQTTVRNRATPAPARPGS